MTSADIVSLRRQTPNRGAREPVRADVARPRRWPTPAAARGWPAHRRFGRQTRSWRSVDDSNQPGPGGFRHDSGQPTPRDDTLAFVAMSKLERVIQARAELRKRWEARTSATP